MTNINLLHVSAPECHPQGGFQIKAMQAERANLLMHHLIGMITLFKFQNT